jgi:DNA-directed RNA polymerase subunit beta
MRDIHSSQYSRICPVRSPEGPNIGLVTYLALYTRINDYGFLESPYLKVTKETKGGKTKMVIGKEIVYLAADDEEDAYITHAGVGRDEDTITQKWVPARFQGKYLEVDNDLIQYIDVVPRQVVGTSASLIPFILWVLITLPKLYLWLSQPLLSLVRVWKMSWLKAWVGRLSRFLPVKLSLSMPIISL